MTAQELAVWEELSSHVPKDFWPRQSRTSGIGTAGRKAVETKRCCPWRRGQGARSDVDSRSDSRISKWGLGFSGRPKHVGALARRGRREQMRSPGEAPGTRETGLGLSGSVLLTRVSWLIPLHLIYFLAGQLLSH